MTRLLARTRWIVLLASCCGLGSVALFARPVSGELAASEVAAAPPRSLETAAAPKTGLSFLSTQPAEIPFHGDAEMFSAATRAAGSVVLLVGLILIAAFLLRRYWPGRFGVASGQRHIEVLETVALGERQSLTLVQVGQSRLLLARSAGSITLLDRVEVAVEAALDKEVEALVEPPEGNVKNLGASLAAVGSRFRRLGARWKASVARGRAVWRPLSQTFRKAPPRRMPSFEQIMRAEIIAAASPSASAGSATRTRLSEIRSRIQSE
jgi:flagellar biosynthetic protein FliO